MNLRKLLIYLHSLFINPQLIEKIFELEDPLEILTLPEDQVLGLDRSKKKGLEKILEARDQEKIKRYFEKIEKFPGRIYTNLDEDFPEELRGIQRPPKVLYSLGQDLDLSRTNIGVVGARKCTKYGQFATRKFVGDLSKLRTTIISGMAQGIDSLAHRTALDNDNYTIGVLGCGVDQVFPKTNLSLFEEVRERGTLLSEYPLGTSPMPYYFPERNRIIAGLSQAVIVVEAKEKSGSLITARLAYEEGKEVFAVPGNINSLYSTGTNRLIADGARPLLDIEDIKNQVPGLEEKPAEKKIEMALSKLEEEILENIDRGNTSLDQLLRATGIEIESLTSTITLLEIKGLIENFGADGYQRI